MKRTLRKIGIVLLILIIGFVVVKRKTIVINYHFLQSANPELRFKYFQNNHHYFDSRIIQKSNYPYQLPVSDTLIHLPESFVSTDSIISTQNYLQDMRYEGILVLKGGEIVFEDYWNGLTKDEVHSAFSVSKTIVSILVGIAIDEGLIGSKDDLITDYLPQFQKTWYKDVKIDDCLDMVSGIKWENDMPLTGNFAVKWGWNFTTAEEFLLETKPWHKPGSFRIYNNMDALVSGLVLKSVIGEKTISEYAYEKLWEPLGAENNAYFGIAQEDDIEIVFSGFSATLKDLVKVGQLYLQKGNWNSKRIISESWVDQSFTAHREENKPIVNDSLGWFYDTYGWGYNNNWWIPDDTNGGEIFAWGIHGQTIYINREKNVVVASFRANPLEESNYNRSFLNRSMVDFMQAICNSIK